MRGGIAFRACLLVVCAVVVGVALRGEAQTAQRGGTSKADVYALLVSDIHFDPFHDPGKARQLDDAPVSEWRAILAGPDSADADAAFASIQKSCHARGEDTAYPLLSASLKAMRHREPAPGFITVTGDLIAHQFPCRYKAVFPDASQERYEAFVEKTIQFVVEQLREAFPGTPVYVSLGNNDSDCGDYKLDAGGPFLQKTAALVAEGLPAAERPAVMREFPAGGYFSVPLKPLRRVRVVVLNDIFLSTRYETCKGAADEAPANAEMDWLEKQLSEARAAGEKVWVMGHIPPGVNAYATLSKLTDVCAGEKAEMFLNADRMDALLARNADEIRLGLFAHTHMDEMRLIGGGSPGPSSAGSVAVKLVPSISPVDGNNPSFTVARVDRTGELKDYAVVVAKDKAGSAWAEEYDYVATYHEKDYSPAAVAGLIAGFKADPKAQQPASQEYIGHYFKGDMGRELTPLWWQYACSLDGLTAESFSKCVCAAAK